MRTHYCGEITEKLIGKTVTLCGWVHRRRNLGGVIFIDLRDREGLAQIVIHPDKKTVFKIAETVRSEFVLTIEGKVLARPEEMKNKNIKTGAIEIEAKKIVILNTAEPPPFALDNYVPVSEEVRLRYRYVDMRRQEILNKVRFRSCLVNAIRQFLNDEGFWEIETPILTKATPEGARDYLVPSRVSKGHFYALPQSPQLFKELLMMGGVDKYYQIAKCFRDEDLRADRQPEFTQLDLEMSFVEEQDVMTLMEEMMRKLFKDLISVKLPKFHHLSYAEAMRRYGSDKPDLRNPLELVDVADLLKKTEFKVFSTIANSENSCIIAMRIPNGVELSRKNIDDYEMFAKKFGARGLAWIKVNSLTDLQSPILKFLPQKILNPILKRVQVKAKDIIFFIADTKSVATEAMGALREKVAHNLRLIDENDWKPVWMVDFPMFEYKHDRWESLHHPFTAPRDEKDPVNSLSRAYDMVINGVELGGGSVRIHQAKLQKKIFKILNITDEEAQERFGFLLEALKYGCPPMGGIAFGLDRIAVMMMGGNSIRDVIAFPKTTTASCPLTDAPSTVEKTQLEELGISVKNK